MPRNGSGVYSADWVNASPNTTIESAKQNAMVADLVADANAARPVTAGGTGETTARLKDGTWRFQNTADTTKLLAFDLSGLTTATTRTQVAPDENGRQALQPHVAGHIYGLTLSNNGADPTNDVDIAAGVAIDSANTHVMTLASALTKRLDASWAVGSSQGMLDGSESVAGTPDVSTWYSIFLIKNPTSGVVDILASESASAPTMPTGYTLKRRIGSVYNDSSGNIKPFFQFGDHFLWNEPDIGPGLTINPGISATLVAVRAPQGVGSIAKLSVQLFDASASGYTTMYISPTTATNAAAATSSPFSVVAPVNSGAVAAVGSVEVFVDGATQIRVRLSASDADVSYIIQTNGYTDLRGRA